LGREISVQRCKAAAFVNFKEGSRPRKNAIREALEAIRADTVLSPEIRQKALANLGAGRISTRTVGFGKAKNSVIGQ
jgi:hypothetical protein